MTSLDRIHVLDEHALSGKEYFLSLLLQGRQCALLTDEDVERIQMESLSLLKEQTAKWSRGKSSSVRVEKAQELLASIYYTVGLALKACPSPEDAIDALKQTALAELYQKGLARVERKLKASKRMYREIRSNLFQTRNVFYRSTVVDGIGGFFKLYSPEFSAQEIHITADYPTFLGVKDLAGVEFIERYLRNIVYENQFCLYFSKERVHRLLCGLDRNYQQIVLNVYEYVLASALGCVLTGRAVRELSCNLDVLKAMLSGKSAEEIERLLSDALIRLVKKLGCPPGLVCYLRASLPKLAGLLHSAMLLGHLETAVLIPGYPEKEPQILFSYGDRMPDGEYAKVLDELLWCDDAARKAEIIMERIRSLGDLLEILRDAELKREELDVLLRRFPPQLIAALLKQYPSDDFLSDEQDIRLCHALQAYCAALPAAARERIEKVAEALTPDTMRCF